MMRPLNAVEAIQPAWTHTRQLLLTPRRWKTFLKIAAVAFFAQMGGCNANFRSPGSGHGVLPPALHVALLASALLIGVIVLIVAACFFYLGSRLQFVLFEVVLRRDTLIAPIWNRYGPATWRWIGLKLLFFACAIVAFCPVIVPAGIHFFRMMRHQSSHPNPLSVLSQLLGVFAAIFFIAIVIGLLFIALRDFGLPSMALEGTPLRITVGRVWNLIRYEPLSVLGYLLMYFLLSLAGTICAYIVLFFASLIALIPFGIAGAVLWVSLHHGGTPAQVFMWAGLALLGLLYLVCFLVGLLLVMGYMLVFLQAYALYFLGGRYPLVGQYLEPLLPVAPSYPYGYAPPAYPPTAVYPPPPPAEIPATDPPLTNPHNAIDTTE